MSKKNIIRLTESELKKVITESVKNIISELDWRTYAKAAAAAQDRENFFKENPSLGDSRFNGNVDRTIRQMEQPNKFGRAAARGLSQEICGEDDFIDYIVRTGRTPDKDPKFLDDFLKYRDGVKYISHNGTKWSQRH